jgi:hypothetical protein
MSLFPRERWSQIRGNPQDRIGGTAGFYVLRRFTKPVHNHAQGVLKELKKG